MASKKVTVSIAMTPRVVRDLDRAAKALGRSRSAVVEDFIVSGLREGEDLVAMLSSETVRRAFAKAMTTPGVARSIAASLGHELTERERQDVLAFLKEPEVKR